MIKPYSGAWDRQAKKHLLKRATHFNIDRAQLPDDMNQAVDQLLSTAEFPFPVKNYRDAELGALADADVEYGEIWEQSMTDNLTLSQYRIGSLKGMMLEQMLLRQDVSMKLAMFFHNHFCTSFNKNADVKYFKEWGNTHLIGAFVAQDNFVNLLRAVTKNPAMLVYLNGYLNHKDQPDENYAREFFELFTLGVGNYTEQDVKEAAKQFTGLRINITGRFFDSDFDAHLLEDSRFSSHFNNVIVLAESNPSISANNMIALVRYQQPDAMARFICRKLYRWFVGYDVTPVIEDTYITDLTNIFKESWSIRAVLEAIFTSDHFYRMAGVMIKSPIEYVMGIVSDFYVEMDVELESRYRQYNYLLQAAERMSQTLGEPPNVKGWKAYYSAPLFYKDWITTDTLAERTRFVDEMLRGDWLKIDIMSWTNATIDNPADPNAMVADACDALLAIPMDDAARAEIKNTYLLNGLADDSYWTRAWNRYQQDPSGENRNTVETRVASMVKYIITSPEYQLQ